MPVTVTIGTAPTVVITNPGAVCAPATINLTAAAVTAGSTPGLTYTYFTDAAGTIALATPNAVASSGTYYIVGTLAAGCVSAPMPVVVTIGTAPTVVITNPGAVCAPATVDLTAAAVTAGSTPGLTYTYFTNAAGTIALATPNAVATSGTYYIVGTLAAGCASAPIPVVVTIGAAPTVVITDPGAVCAPATVDLTVAAITAGSTAGLTYTYFTNAAGTIALATPNAVATSGTYYIVGTPAAGCVSAPMPVVVTIRTGATAIVVTPTDAACGTNNGIITLGAVTGGVAPYLYSVNGSAFTTTTVYNNLAAGSYPVAVQDANGCTYNAPVANINNIGGPTAIAVTPADATCGNNDGSITLGAVTGGVGPYTYDFNNSGTFTSTTVYNNLAAGTYPIAVKDANGCIYNAPAEVINTTGVPTVVITDPAAVCAPATIDLTAAAVTAGSTAGLTYTYFTDAAGTIALATPNAIAASGAYYIKGTLAAGCASAVMPVVATIRTGATAIVVTPTNTACGANNGVITLGAVTGGVAPYLYSVGGSAFTTTTVYNNLAAGSYAIAVQDANGCTYNAPAANINNTGGPTAIAVTPTDATCGNNNGSVILGAVTGGVGPFTYDFNNSGTFTATTIYNNLAAGSYPIAVKDANGCIYNAPAALINTTGGSPTVVITNPGAVCAPATVNLTAAAVTAGSTPGLTYTYFTDAAGTITLATPNAVATSGTYYIVGTLAAGCASVPMPVTVTIGAAPTVVITNPGAVCAPATVNLTAAAVTAGSTAGLTYTYFRDAAGTIALATPNAVATSGTYYIVGTLAAGCASAPMPVIVTIGASPTVVITNPGAVCAPGTVDLTAAAVTAGSTAGLTYTYFTDAAGTIALATPAAVATGGTYYIVGTLAAGCVSAPMPVNVTIGTAPTVVITNPGAVCAPGTVNLTAAAITAGSTAGLTYTYFTDAAGTLPLATPSAVATSGTYYIVGTLAAGCVSAPMPVVVTIGTSPTVVITNPGAVCAPATIDLTAAAVTAGSTAGLTYTYFTDAAGTIALATPNAVVTSGTYYIVGTLAAGCVSAPMPVVVTIGTSPTVVITNPGAVCAPGTVNLTAAAITAGSTAGLTYSYFTDAAGTLPLATPAAVATSGTYYIVGTLAAGCVSAPMPVIVTIGTSPTVVITNPGAVCAPATVNLTAAAVTAGSTAGLTYTYFTDAAGTLPLATPAAVATSGTYYIVGTLAAGCVSAPMPVVVTIGTSPTVVITNPGAVCAPGTVNLTAAAITAGSTAGLTYTYFTDAAGTLPLATPAAVATGGTYYIVGTLAAGCVSAPMPVVVTIRTGATAIVVTPTNAACGNNNGTITLGAVTGGVAPYLYSVGGSAFSATTVYNNLTAGTYSISVQDANGCVYNAPDVNINNTGGATAIVATPTDATCGNNNGSVTLGAVTGGVGPYTYDFNNSGTFTATTVYNNLAAGTYPIAVKDANGCIFNAPDVTVGTSGALVTPTFTQIAPLCQNSAPPALPLTSINGIAGTWNPATINTSILGPSTYSFTPNAGQCATGATMNITISNQITPTFTAIGPLCQNSVAPTLPLASINGITGTWNPAAINTATLGTAQYIFTPDAGQCGATVRMNITITNQITPTFNAIGPLCQNSAAPALSLTSLNGITGTWNPATINSAIIGQQHFIFTPDAGQCGSTTSLDVNITNQITPTFATIGPLCQNSAAPALPLSSTNGITGTWSPATISTTTVGQQHYTFTPDAGQCGTSAGMDITITTQITPAFAAIGPLCQNSTAPVLPLTSTNGITGTWNPAVINTAIIGSIPYTFTPDAGQCGVPVTIPIDIVNQITPTFDPIGPLCLNSVPPALPTVSNNGITGSWSPSISTGTVGATDYTFTPDAGQCGTTAIIKNHRI